MARRICEAAKLSTRARRRSKIGRSEADALYQAIQQTKIRAPSTDCISPIGEELILKGLHQVVPGEFYAAATRPPAVYRGNPFQIEVGLAYGGAADGHDASRCDALVELLARERRPHAAAVPHQHLRRPGRRRRRPDPQGSRASAPGSRPASSSRRTIERLHEAMRNVNLGEGQTMQVLRYANRVPLQFQQAGCAITQAVMGTNWRSYGLSQSRGSLPSGPVTVMVHMASVWVPFTSESKEAIAVYPEIQKELRLALQAVGRKLGMYLRRRDRVKQEGERRNIFLRYLGEVATAVSEHQRRRPRRALRAAARRSPSSKTAEADVKLDDRGRPIEDDDEDDFGEQRADRRSAGLPTRLIERATRGRRRRREAEDPTAASSSTPTRRR